MSAYGAIACAGFPGIATTNRQAAQELAVAEVKCIAPTRISGTDIEYAQGVRAGSWLFFTGHMAIDFEHGLAAQVIGKPGHPLGSPPRYRREGDFIIERLAKLTAAQGSDLRHIVRVDQYYPNAQVVNAYQRARKAALKDFVPPSVRAHGRAIGRRRHHGRVHDCRPARRRP
jgi:hypothetical protein